MNTFKILLNLSYSGIFWGWNLIFIITVYLGILPYIGIPLVLATFDGDIALDFCITFFTLVAIPVGFCFLGGKYLSRQPKQLMRLFYGVEAPLFAWCLIRLFLVRELTLASGLLLGTLLTCVFIFAVEIFKNHQENLQINSWLKIVTHSLLLLMGTYLGLVLLFYAIPVAINIIFWIGHFLVAFFSFKWIEGFFQFLINGNGFLD